MTQDRRAFLTLAGAGVAGFALWGCSSQPAQAAERFEVTLTDAQWRKKLSPDAYDTLRKEGTERPYSSPLNGEHRAGIFSCGGCALPNFSSKTKFESGTSWPSFWKHCRTRCGRGWIRRWGWRGPRCIVGGAAGIWGTCSTMGLSLRGSAIA